MDFLNILFGSSRAKKEAAEGLRLREIGYDVWPLEKVLATLHTLGYHTESITDTDQLRTSSRTAMPTMGGGYTPLGVFATSLGKGGDAKVVGKVIYVKPGVSHDDEEKIHAAWFSHQFGFYPGEDRYE